MTEEETVLFTLAQRDTLELVIETGRQWLRDYPLHTERGNRTLQAFVAFWEAQLRMGDSPPAK